MEFKNVIFAIVLSFAVLLSWSLFFETPQVEKQNENQQTEVVKKNNTTNSDVPTVDTKNGAQAISRENSIEGSDRFYFENKNVKGSITLKGALIDDIVFKNYKEEINDNRKVVYLNPKETKDGYFIETGWATSNLEKASVPSPDSEWKVKGNKKLLPGNPVIIEWNNKSGLIFRKKIELDDKFLFKVTQEVQNNTKEKVELYPYAQITRNQSPDITNFYILHEGFIGVFDEQLEEIDYDDIKEKKEKYSAEEGWLGITDKYWMTALVPENDQSFKAEFLYKNAFKANYILNKPIVVSPSSSKTAETKVFVAAKEVRVIDNYAKNLDIEKFALMLLPILDQSPGSKQELEEGERDGQKGEMVGFVGTNRYKEQGMEVGYVINRRYWGLGYATEGLRLFLNMYWGLPRKLLFLSRLLIPSRYHIFILLPRS